MSSYFIYLKSSVCIYHSILLSVIKSRSPTKSRCKSHNFNCASYTPPNHPPCIELCAQTLFDLQHVVWCLKHEAILQEMLMLKFIQV